MSDRHPSGRPGLTQRRATAALALAFVLVVVAGCGTIGAFIDLQRNLESDGFTHITVNIDRSTNGSGLLIDAHKPPNDTVDVAITEAARITWTTFDRRIETLRIDMNGTGELFDRAQMTSKFGTRDASLDAKSLQGDTQNLGKAVFIALAVGFVVVVGVIVLIVLLYGRSKRKKQAAWAAQNAGGGWGGGGGGGYPAPGAWPPAPTGQYPPPGQYPPTGAYPPPGDAPPPGSYPPPPQPPPAPPAEPPHQKPPGWG